MKLGKLLVEAFVVGLSLVVIGNAVGYGVSKFWYSVELPEICKEWNEFYEMELSLFLTGFLGHLLFEVTGVNRWYCKHGHACK